MEENSETVKFEFNTNFTKMRQHHSAGRCKTVTTMQKTFIELDISRTDLGTWDTFGCSHLISAEKIAALEACRGLDYALGALGRQLGMAGINIKDAGESENPRFTAQFYLIPNEPNTDFGIIMENNPGLAVRDVGKISKSGLGAVKRALLRQILILPKLSSQPKGVKQSKGVNLYISHHNGGEPRHHIILG